MHGEPLHEMSDNDPGRYGKWTTKEYVHEKCRETYGFNNILVYPKEERPYGRKMRINSIYDVCLEQLCLYWITILFLYSISTIT